MIKHLSFLHRLPGTSHEAFVAELHAALTELDRDPHLPDDSRPIRVTTGAILPDLAGTAAPHDAVVLRWFVDAQHLQRHEQHLASAPAHGGGDPVAGLVDEAATQLVVAHEVIGRGADWLEERWRAGGPKLKHMAIARRGVGLTPAEFSERWRSRAGSLKVRTGPAGPATTVELPDAVKGLAYIQNHPVDRPDGDWGYDAVNEVYFDDLAGLQVRIDHFASVAADLDESDLVREFSYLAVREVPVS